MESLGWTFLPFLFMIIAGVALVLYWYFHPQKAFVKEEVVEPIMEEVSRLNIDAAKPSANNINCPSPPSLNGLDRIQDDELDTESIEKVWRRRHRALQALHLD